MLKNLNNSTWNSSTDCSSDIAAVCNISTHHTNTTYTLTHPCLTHCLYCTSSNISTHHTSHTLYTNTTLGQHIHLVSEGPRRRLRSSTDRSCAVPRTHNTFGDRSFAVAGPRVWNSLPANLRDEDITYTSFRHELKTYWFSGGRGAMWHSA